MLTRPKNIVAHPVAGTLGLTAIDSLFPGDSLGEGIPPVKFRARVPFSIWLHGRALSGEARAAGMGVHIHLPRGPSHLFAGLPRLTWLSCGLPC